MAKYPFKPKALAVNSLSLSIEDIQGMLSSLLMAELSYNDRLLFSEGSTLKSDFIPSSDTVKDFDAVRNKVLTIFNVSANTFKTGTSLQKWANSIHTEWMQSEKHITFFTSGSTGIPKPNTHDIVLHEQEVNALAHIFHGRTRIVSFAPHHHIYGFLFSVLLPKAMNIPVVSYPPLPTLGTIRQLTPGDLVIAFPLLWNKLAEMAIEIVDDVHGVTSTGPCPAKTIATLRDKGVGRMYEIYGSSETGGVGYRSKSGGYNLLPYWSIGNDASQLTRAEPNGHKRQYELQDILKWDGETFLPIKRNDDGVQVAGVNVFPDRVKRIFLTHPYVKECAVRLMSQDEGGRLKVLLVSSCHKHENEIEKELRKWAKQQLSQYEFPSRWDFTDKLPLNIMGKPQNW